MSKNKLEKKYAISILLVSLVGLVIMVAMQAWQLRHSAAQLKEQSRTSYAQEANSQLEQRGIAIAEYLSHNLAEPFLAFEMLVLYDLILPVRQAEGVNEVYFYDVNGKIFHDGSREIFEFGEDINERYPLLRVNSAEGHILNFDGSIAVVRPVMVQDKLLGGVIIELDATPFAANMNAMQGRLDEITNQSMQRNLMALVFTSMLLILLAALSASFAGRRLARPISELADQADRIGGGDYENSVNFHRDDEIGDLATAFEDMRFNLRQQKERIEYQAYYDSLTGLRNRGAFHKLMSSILIGSPGDQKHVLLYIDIDEFKRVNDGLGHGAGDRLLQEFSTRLVEWSKEVAGKRGLRGSCEIARWSGDQFVVLLTEVTDVSVINGYAEQMLKELSQPSDIAGIEVVLSSSVGFAVYPDDAKDSDTLISFADLAMYKSKERGKNLVSSYVPQQDAAQNTNLVLESEIRNALRAGQFELLYYPSVDSTSKTVAGLEVLVQWNHPQRGRLPASQFWTAINSAGLMKEFRVWGYNAGLDTLKKWHQQGYQNLKMTFNLANLEFEPSWLGDIIADGLERTEINSRDVMFEISESSFSNNIIRTAEVLEGLGTYGVRVWIDSFGIGYSAINRLRRVSIAGIKLHHSIVKNINTSQDSQNMVAASIAMAHGFGIRAGADGVEDEQQLNFLRSKGCDFVQGTLASKPLTAREVDDYLATSYAGPRLVRTS